MTPHLAPETADQKDFLDVQQQLKFRTITTLLQITSFIAEKEHGLDPRVGRSSESLLFKSTQHFAALMVRHREIVAVALLQGPHRFGAVHCSTGQSQDADRDTGADDEYPDPHTYMATENSRPDDHRIPSSADIIPTLTCEVADVIGGGIATEAQDLQGIARYYVNRIRASQRAGDRKIDIPFGIHVQNLVSLLQEGRRATTRLCIRNSYLRLRFYVFLSSCEKIKTRLHRGGKNPRYPQRDFFGILTSDIEDSAATRSMYPLSGSSTPTKFQRTALQGLFALLPKDLLSDEAQNRFLDVKNASWYDKEGRATFHKILRGTLKGVESSLTSLCKAKKECKSRPQLSDVRGNSPRTSDSQRMQDIHNATGTVCDWVCGFKRFRNAYKQHFKSHLGWIYCCWYSTPNPKSGGQSTVGDEAPGPSQIQEDLDVDPEDVEDDLGDDFPRNDGGGGGDDVGVDLDDLTFIKGRDNWRRDANKYLDFLLAHASAISYLGLNSPRETENQKRVSAVVKNAVFETIIVKPASKDRKMLSMEKLLADFEVCYELGPLPPDLQEILIYRIKEMHQRLHGYRPDFQSESFSGTYHCETALMSLELLARHRKLHAGADESINPTANRVALPHRRITDKLTSISMLPVSKLCCPACSCLLEYLRLQSRTILHPGGHANWSACALPPWLPKDAGQHVLDKASSVLRDRIWDIMVEEAKYFEQETGYPSPPHYESVTVEQDSSDSGSESVASWKEWRELED